jgi:hypothetical protein
MVDNHLPLPYFAAHSSTDIPPTITASIPAMFRALQLGWKDPKMRRSKKKNEVVGGMLSNREN